MRFVPSFLTEGRRTLLLAGHDTSANSLTWFFWELAKHPESAREIREEIAAVRARIGARDFSITDLEGMSTMLAALKVRRTSSDPSRLCELC